MQLGRILQQNSNLRPPFLSDWPQWIAFRTYFNEKLKLKRIIESTLFKLVSALLILVAFLNASLCLFTTNSAYELIDQVFINIFFI